MKKLFLAIATIFLVPGMSFAATPAAYDAAPALVACSPAPFSFSVVCPRLHTVAMLRCIVLSPCGRPTDCPLVREPHPASGELRGTFAPEDGSFPISAVPSVLFSGKIGRQEQERGMQSILCTVG